MVPGSHKSIEEDPEAAQGIPARISPRRRKPRRPHEAGEEWFESDIRYHIECANSKRFKCDLCHYVTKKFECILKECTALCI